MGVSGYVNILIVIIMDRPYHKKLLVHGREGDCRLKEIVDTSFLYRSLCLPSVLVALYTVRMSYSVWCLYVVMLFMELYKSSDTLYLLSVTSSRQKNPLTLCTKL